MTDVRYGVVVGYDGSASADQAVDWAAAEAAARSVRLTVCHVWQLAYSGMMVPAVDEFERAAAEVAHSGVRRALDAVPGLDAHPLVACGSQARTLLDVGRSADLLVVGSHGVSGVRELLLGSVSAQVAAHAAGPVVVVRGESDPSPEYYPGRIVVGVDGSPAADRALGFAFEEAELHHVPLTAVCAWSRQVAEDAAALPYVGGQALGELAEERFRESVARWSAKHPGVQVHLDLRDEPVVPLMLSLAAEARLLVVGSRGLGGVRARVLGSVSQAILHQAPCPVAVVHTAA